MEFDADQIVQSGACIGCGLCAAVSGGAIRMAWTPEARMRPVTVGDLGPASAADAAAACPALVAGGLDASEAGEGAHADPIWGYWHRAHIGWAGDPELRHRASTGGVLSALSAHLLDTGQADFILHLGPDPDRPTRGRYRISRTPEEAADSGGSWYAPAAPLEGLTEARTLADQGQRFAFVGKPCDVSAIRLLAQRQDWLADALTHRLTIMCGGASDFRKTADLLAGWGMAEEDVTELRYRGYGNPGPTYARDRDDRRAETTYQALWEDETSWALQHRCKICPDAIGMAADVVSFDCWPGGGPEGEDAGFNAVMTRTPVGEQLLTSAVAAGAVVLDTPIGADDFEDFQPHQSRKRLAVWARLVGQRAATGVAPEARGLGTADLARRQPFDALLRQARGTRDRVRSGRGTEPAPEEST
ncbi:MAG: Coenzyme F420 hydrogenase/dehydrogenase, beta subunit C-terminal domain [Pseudomonadota bacterium]